MLSPTIPLFCTALILNILSCTGNPESKTISEPLSQKKGAKKKTPLELTDKTANLSDTRGSSQEDRTCLRNSQNELTVPFWLKDAGFVVTRFLKECTSSTGRRGYRNDSPWVAMGFPCTGGEGRVEVGGHYYAPKIVSLIISTDCPMRPPTLSLVHDAGSKALNLTEKAKLMAFNPFAVQYWEIPGYEDADVGFTIDLRSTKAKQELWQKFLAKAPLSVKLFGRENAWMRGYDFFEVDADLIHSGPGKFRLEVKKVAPLQEDDIVAIRHRCESLHPRRSCSSVFKWHALLQD